MSPSAPDNKRERVVAALYVEFMENGFSVEGRPTAVRRLVRRGEVVRLDPTQEAEADMKGSLCPLEWGLGDEARARLDRSLTDRREAYIRAHQSIVETPV